MDIDVLKTFLEVDRSRHFGKAAEELFVTQSTVSSRIKQLEESLGSPVFVRQRNDIQLTPAGQRLKKYAESILTTWNRARQEIVIEEESQQTLSIAGVMSLWDIALQQWLQRVTQQHDVVIQADALSLESIHRRLLEGMVDLGFVFEAPQSMELIVKEIFTVPLRLVSNQPNIDTRTAMQSNYVLVDWGTSFAISHAKLFPASPLPRLRTGLGRIARDLILQQGGAAYLAEAMVEEAVREQQLFYVADAPILERSAYAVYAEATDKTDLIRELLKLFD